VEFHHYIEMKDLVNKAMKVERQQNQKGAAMAFPNSSSKWSSKWNKHDEKKEMKGSKPQGAASTTKDKGAAQASFKNDKGNSNSTCDTHIFTEIRVSMYRTASVNFVGYEIKIPCLN
jgi:hypothetical protein